MSKKDQIEILYEDANLLAINKPAGTSVTADRTGKPDIMKRLTDQRPDLTELRRVHRLDKETSGIMLLTRNRHTQSILSRAFTSRLIDKTYLALVSGYVADPKRTIKVPLARSRREPHKMAIDPRRGKPAVTKYQVLADFGLLSLVAVRLITGRTHQIRIHMSHLGLPLTIDPLYGDTRPLLLSDVKTNYRRKPDREETPLIDRLTLHAYSLHMPELEGLPERTFVAPLDKKMAAAVKMLAKHNPRGHDAFLDPAYLDRILNSEPLGLEWGRPPGIDAT